MQAEVIAEETIEIADGAPGVIVGEDKSDNARVQAEKLRVDTRTWYLSVLKPKKYGNKVDLTSQGERLFTGFEKLNDEDFDKEIERLERLKDQARLRTGGEGKAEKPGPAEVR